MKAKIVGFREVPGKYSAHFYLIFFRTVEGKNYRTYADPANRNYPRWAKIIEASKTGEIWLDNLILKTVKGQEIVDADSEIKICLERGKGEPGAESKAPRQATPALPLFEHQNWEKGRERIREMMGSLK